MNEEGISPIGVGLGVSMVGLTLFTAIVLGVFTPKDEKVVYDTLTRAKISTSSYVIALPKAMFDDGEGASFLRRFKGATNQLYVCTVSKDQFTQLNRLIGVEPKIIKDYAILWLDGDENTKDVFSIISRSEQQETCIGAETHMPFYIDSPKTISRARGGDV